MTTTRRVQVAPLLALAALVVLWFAAAPAAQAQYGPAGGAAASDSTVASGASIDVSASGCAPGSTVHFALDGAPLGSGVTGGDGVAHATVVIRGTPGPHHITNSCNEAVIVIEIQGAVAPAPLPRTGSTHVGLLVRMAILAITSGWLLLVWSRRHLAVPPR